MKVLLLVIIPLILPFCRGNVAKRVDTSENEERDISAPISYEERLKRQEVIRRAIQEVMIKYRIDVEDYFIKLEKDRGDYTVLFMKRPKRGESANNFKFKYRVVVDTKLNIKSVEKLY